MPVTRRQLLQQLSTEDYVDEGEEQAVRQVPRSPVRDQFMSAGLECAGNASDRCDPDIGDDKP